MVQRFPFVDPLAESYTPWSPYNYVMGNPINSIDPDGRYTLTGQAAQDAFRELQQGASLSSVHDNYKDEGDYNINVALYSNSRDKTLQKDLDALKGTSYHLEEVSSARNAYSRLNTLQNEGYTINNVLISSHGVSYDYPSSYRFKIGNTKYQTVKGVKNSTWIRKIGTTMSEDGCFIIAACHAGSERTNGAEMMKAIANVTNKSVYASLSWVWTNYGTFQNGTPSPKDPRFPNPNYSYALKNRGRWTRTTPDGNVDYYTWTMLTKSGGFLGIPMFR